MNKIILGGGCFWCIDAVYREISGVTKVLSGYAGGDNENPTYEQICTGRTNHAEVVLVEFDPSQITFEEILGIFFSVHDPTTLNRQGNDAGTQYRSAIYYYHDEQKTVIDKILEEAQSALSNRIVTQVAKLEIDIGPFYEGEDYHQDYYKQNPGAGYCNYIITPKMNKFRRKYADKLIN